MSDYYHLTRDEMPDFQQGGRFKIGRPKYCRSAHIFPHGLSAFSLCQTHSIMYMDTLPVFGRQDRTCQKCLKIYRKVMEHR